jgi:hypothetical protein
MYGIRIKRRRSTCKKIRGKELPLGQWNALLKNGIELISRYKENGATLRSYMAKVK